MPLYYSDTWAVCLLIIGLAGRLGDGLITVCIKAPGPDIPPYHTSTPLANGWILRLPPSHGALAQSRQALHDLLRKKTKRADNILIRWRLQEQAVIPGT